MSILEVITAAGVVVGALTLLETVRRYLRDQFKQQAAQMREELQEIIGVCGLFLHPLNQSFPYPITVELQLGICKVFNDEYKDKIERSLYFIQTAASMFIGLNDKQLKHLSETHEGHTHFFRTAINMLIGLKDRILRNFAKTSEVQSTETSPNKTNKDPLIKLKHEGSPLKHYKNVMRILAHVRHDIGESNYYQLYMLIEPLKIMCEQFEKLKDNALEERTLVNV